MILFEYIVNKSLGSGVFKQIAILFEEAFGTVSVMHNAGYAETSDGKFIFICGGFNKHWSLRHGKILSRDIHVFDIEQRKIFKTMLTLPPGMSGSLHAICMKTKESDKLLVNGFVNNCYKKSQFSDMRQLPHYLIQIIDFYFENEYLHALNVDGRGEHWKININCVINSIITDDHLNKV